MVTDQLRGRRLFRPLLEVQLKAIARDVGFGLLLIAMTACHRTPPPPQSNAAGAVHAIAPMPAWLAGQWRGSGGDYAAFFEEYRALNDSTMQQLTIADSTFTTATDSSVIEWRGGEVRMLRNGVVRYTATPVTADSLAFTRPGDASGGFIWLKETDDRWMAILDGPSPGSAPIVYRMVRVGR